MNKVRNILLVMTMTMFTSTATIAQDKVQPIIAGDIVSSYIWRGQDCGSAAIQPTLGLSYKGLSLSAWGSVGLTSAADTKELDLTLSYTIGGLNVGVTDYWFSVGQDPKSRYFMYKTHRTNHVFEANLGYDFGVVNFQAYTNFAGNDGLNDSGKRAFSTFLELSAPFRLATCDWTAAVSAVPMATTTYATSGFAVTNISLRAEKAIRITDTFSLPLFAKVIANPCSQKAYFVVGFTLQPSL